jgi:hypothetical protein
VSRNFQLGKLNFRFFIFNTYKIAEEKSTYNQPNKTPEEIEAMISNGSIDILLSFSEACRLEFAPSLQI